MPFTWSDSHGARLGIIPRGAGLDALRWIEIEPCFVFHVANAFEEADGTIAIDVSWYKSLWRGGPDAFSERPVFRRWRIGPGASKAHEESLDDRPMEFPRINDAHAGLRHSVVYAAGLGTEIGRGGSLIRYDLSTGKSTVREFGNGMPNEFAFVSAGPDAGEDEGWLMGFVYDHGRDASDLMILNAQDIGGEAAARIKLPKRVPQGFHGNWVPDAAL